MGNYLIRTDPYFKEKLTEIKNKQGLKAINCTCEMLISELQDEIIEKLQKMEFDKVLDNINCIYADFNSKETPKQLKEEKLSIRLSIISDYYIQQCLTAWNTNKDNESYKVTISDTLRVLLSTGSIYMQNSNQLLKRLGISSITMSPPYVCYQHGNKENSKIKSEITEILKQIPPHINTVVEPFMGMCGLTLNALDTLSGRKLDYYANDADVNLINLYRCIQHQPKKMMLACERVIENLNSKNDTFETIRDRHRSEKKMSKYDYNAAADYMYLDAVSYRHKTDNCQYTDIEIQIKYFYKYIINIPRLHQYLERIDISNKDALNVLKKFKKVLNVLFLLDPPYLDSCGYSKKTNGVKKFTDENYEELIEFCLNVPDGSIFLLFCRFTQTRSGKRGETNEDIRAKEMNGDFKIGDKKLEGYYRRRFGVKAQLAGKQFYYKEIPFDGKGTKEVIISNHQFDGFIPF